MKQNRIFSCIKTTIYILVSLFSFNTQLFCQGKAIEIDQIITLYNEYGQFDGSILVSENGNILLKKGYGLANREWNIPNNYDTKFLIGSITKPFTSFIIMQLVEEGKIFLEGNIIDYLPDYRKDTGEKITIHHLLTHSSGLPNFINLPGFFETTSLHRFSVSDFIKEGCSSDLLFEPGKNFAYSNSGYFILGAIIEKVTGMTYEENLHYRILNPLNMKNSGYLYNESILLKRASGYEKVFNDYINAPYADMSIPYSACGMYSTLKDLYIWLQQLNTTNLLTKKYKDIMLSTQFPLGEGISSAYGWFLSKINISGSKENISFQWHSGEFNGFKSLVRIYPKQNNIIIILSNLGKINLGPLSDAITNILLNEPYDLPKKSIADTLYRIIIEKGIIPAKECFYDLQKSNPDDYDFSKDKFYTLGVYLGDHNYLNESIEIFNLIIELYPDWWRAFSGIANSYRMKGEIDLAIKNYKKSLELNPNNSNDKEILTKLTENYK